MNFWDSSCLLPLLVAEERSRATRRFLKRQPGMVIWWAAPVECMSALARKEREGALDLAQMEVARRNLETIAANSICVDATDRVRSLAQKLLRRHPLRAADSLQLAAACVFAGEGTEAHRFVCSDERLKTAASKEGFKVVAPGS
jgi:predicted nucleic acid-binding protein